MPEKFDLFQGLLRFPRIPLRILWHRVSGGIIIDGNGDAVLEVGGRFFELDRKN